MKEKLLRRYRYTYVQIYRFNQKLYYNLRTSSSTVGLITHWIYWVIYLPQYKVDQEAQKSVRSHGYRHSLGAVVGGANLFLRLPGVCDPHPGVTQHPGGVPQCPHHLGRHDAHNSSENHGQLQNSTERNTVVCVTCCGY